MLSNFQTDNSCVRKQLEDEVKNGIVIKKTWFVSEKFSEMGAVTERAQFGSDYGHKIQSRNPIRYFAITKQIVCNRPLQILASL